MNSFQLPFPALSIPEPLSHLPSGTCALAASCGSIDTKDESKYLHKLVILDGKPAAIKERPWEFTLTMEQCLRGIEKYSKVLESYEDDDEE